MYKKILILLFMLSQIVSINAQKNSPNPLLSEKLLIVQTASESNWIQVHKALENSDFKFSLHEVAKDFNIYGIYPLENNVDLYKWLNTRKGVLNVSKNYAVQARYTPNDELYSEQWAHEVVKANDTWLNSKGDTTALGDEIVIALIDNGILTTHPDLTEQIWRNKHEIPDNGIDDDGNGYVDDYTGWNVDNENDKHDAGWHGSPVAGIIGATTDNEEGIAGTAYRTKILPLSPYKRIVMIERALQYIYTQRKLYNETNGEKGAFIVAVNLSLGVGGLFPDSVKSWCNLHDSLGKIGILTVNSVTNDLADIGQEGDVPALCPTDYLIAVTRTDQNDKLSEFESGYSSEFVDLGAPGDDIMSTSDSGMYRNFNGTSAAAPFVSGAIATLYSIPCKDFALQARENPAQTALAVKDLILSNVDNIPTLEGKSVTGGRLNIYKAIIASTEFCNIETDPFEVQVVYPNPSTGVFHFNYTVETFSDLNVDLYDMRGRHLFNRTFSPQVFGERTFTIDIGYSMQDGVYLIKVQQGQDVKWGKLVLQKQD